MLLNKVQQRNKHALATFRQLNELHHRRWHEKWVPCKPFQYGWIRDWDLRPDVAARADAADFRKILRHIGCSQWCKTQDFQDIGFGRKKREPMDPPPLRPIDVRPHYSTGEEIGWPKDLPESLKKWFYRHERDAPFCFCYPKDWRFRPAHYSFRTPWMFQLRIRPAYISKLPACDGDLDTQIAQLQQHMYCNNFYPTISHLQGHPANRGRSNLRRSKLAEDAAQKELRTELYESTAHLDS